MTSPLQVVTTQGGLPTTTPPLLSSLHVEDDKENLNVPYTPTSSAASGSSSSRRHHSVHIQQHRKSSSLSNPATQARPPSKTHSRSLSLCNTQVQSLALKEGGVLESHSGREVKFESVTMITPPENLPPSPPLTNHEVDGDCDAEEGGGDAAAEARAGAREEDITEAWRENAEKARQSRDVTRDHPLDEGSPGDARVDVDLEKGPEEPVSPKPTRPSADVDVAQAGVTRPFEVVRPPKRTALPKPPHSSYYIGPPTSPTAYATPACGQIGVHHPREIIRIERDYDHGELVQFSTSYPLELQGRITPTQFLETINALNEGLIRAHSLASACIDNTLAVLTLWLSTLFVESTYDKEMKRLQQLVDALNAELYNPQGLNILWPRKCAFLFVSGLSFRLGFRGLITRIAAGD
jgi:Golgin subfamily A member 7/ERF4 family